jgi:hypothetical protein
MHRALKIAGASVLALVLVVGVFGAFARPKVRRITTVAGRNFD